jgi:hypothetical protein
MAGVDITGQKHGRLTAIARIGTDRHGKALWSFLCECGRVTSSTATKVKNGRVQSCGCLRAENAAQVSRDTATRRGNAIATHGMSRRGARTSEHMIWTALRERCTKPACKAYPNYGGRGITVCDRWNESFEAFYTDMGSRPSKLFSIDRIDNDGPYAPENCRWATRAEQKANQRPRQDALWLTHEGERKTLDEWARVKGFKYSTLHARLKHGWSTARALNTETRSYPL